IATCLKRSTGNALGRTASYCAALASISRRKLAPQSASDTTPRLFASVAANSVLLFAMSLDLLHAQLDVIVGGHGVSCAVSFRPCRHVLFGEPTLSRS